MKKKMKCFIRIKYSRNMYYQKQTTKVCTKHTTYVFFTFCFCLSFSDKSRCEKWKCFEYLKLIGHLKIHTFN